VTQPQTTDIKATFFILSQSAVKLVESDVTPSSNKPVNEKRPRLTTTSYATSATLHA